MAQIPTPPSHEASVEPVKVGKYVSQDKVQQLEKLLERYLYLIDRHQTLRAKLGRNLSSGFFSLTHANYCSPGRRFGEDFYDERMKATRRLNITTTRLAEGLQAKLEESVLEKFDFEVAYKSVLSPEDEEEDDNSAKQEKDKTPPENEKNNDHDDQNSTSSGTESDEQVPAIMTPSTSSENQGRADEDNGGEETQAPTRKKPFRSDDPISWYGILVPPSLRSAQQSFTEAASSEIPQLASVMSEMRNVENLVYQLRKEVEAI